MLSLQLPRKASMPVEHLAMQTVPHSVLWAIIFPLLLQYAPSKTITLFSLPTGSALKQSTQKADCWQCWLVIAGPLSQELICFGFGMRALVWEGSVLTFLCAREKNQPLSSLVFCFVLFFLQNSALVTLLWARFNFSHLRSNSTWGWMNPEQGQQQTQQSLCKCWQFI